jgi:hypothetical protein
MRSLVRPEQSTASGGQPTDAKRISLRDRPQAMCTRIGLFTFKFCLCDLSLDGTTLEQNFQHPLIASDFYCQ